MEVSGTSDAVLVALRMSQINKSYFWLFLRGRRILFVGFLIAAYSYLLSLLVGESN